MYWALTIAIIVYLIGVNSTYFAYEITEENTRKPIKNKILKSFLWPIY